MTRFFQVQPYGTFSQLKELAGISKVPTRLLLEDMVERGDLIIQRGKGPEKLYHSKLLAATPQWKTHVFTRSEGYRQLVKLLEENPRITQAEIERKLSHAMPPVKRSTARYRLKQLVEAGIALEDLEWRKAVYSLRSGVGEPFTFDLGEREAVEAEQATQFSLLIEAVGTFRTGLQDVVQVSLATLRLYEHQGAAATSREDLDSFDAAMDAFEASAEKPMDERKFVTTEVLGAAGNALRRAATGLRAKLP